MRRGGFTILELCLVLAVIIVASAIAVPSITAMYADVKLTAASDLVRARWAEARARAVEDGMPYRFAVVPQSNRFRVEPDIAENPEEPGVDARPLVLDDELPGGVEFAVGETDGEGGADGMQTIAVFLPDGTARSDVEIVFRAGGQRSLVLRLRSLTGAVSAQFESGR
jgi:Tfp pilus assembly protein FimT